MRPDASVLTQVERALVKAIASAIVREIRREDEAARDVGHSCWDVHQQGAPPPRGDQPAEGKSTWGA
jgi:hypothetical protein